MTMTDEHPSALAHQEHAHPGPRRYVQIAAILATLTALEVELSYLPKQVDISSGVIIPPLVILAVIKFALVAMFFMHLRFDSKVFTFMFVGGIALAMTVFIVVLSIQRVLFS